MTTQDHVNGASTSRRSFLQGAGGLALVLGAAPGALVACSGSSGGSATSKAGPIVMWSQQYGADPRAWAKYTSSVASNFKSQGHGEVNWQIVPWTSAQQKWDLAMSNCSNPDVGDMFFLQSRIAQGKGKCSPLDITQEVKSGTFGDWNRFVPIAQREASYQDRIYGIPWRIDIRTLVSNSDLWQPVKTLAEFESQAVEIVGQHKVTAAAQVGIGAHPYQALKQIGALWNVEFLTADLKKSALDDERWMEACLWTADMVKKQVFLQSALTDQKAPSAEAFANKSVAVVFGGNPSVRAAARAVSAEFAAKVHASPMPIGAAGRPIGLASTAQLTIFESTSSKDTAMAWLKYLTSTTTAAEMAKNAAEQSSDTNVQQQDQDPFLQPFYDTSKTALGIDQPTPKWTQLTAVPEGPLSKLAIDLFTGKDVRQAVQSAHEATQKILDQ